MTPRAFEEIVREAANALADANARNTVFAVSELPKPLRDAIVIGASLITLSKLLDMYVAAEIRDKVLKSVIADLTEMTKPEWKQHISCSDPDCISCTLSRDLKTAGLASWRDMPFGGTA